MKKYFDEKQAYAIFCCFFFVKIIWTDSAKPVKNINLRVRYAWKKYSLDQSGQFDNKLKVQH